MHLNKIYSNIFFYSAIITLSSTYISCYNRSNVITSNSLENNSPQEIIENNNPKNFKIISLGDSYTIGQNVCESCSFPEQLKDSLIVNFDEQDSFQLDIIAQTG